MNRRVAYSKPFVRDYQALPDPLKTEVDKAIRLLLDNPRHPSLQMKKIQPKARGIFEVRVTQGYRLTLHLDTDTFVLRRVGTHDILRTP
jgi:mRNA-degrading endonuclease RelE of RelBE toxin-antitoxin system